MVALSGRLKSRLIGTPERPYLEGHGDLVSRLIMGIIRVTI